jgi:DNA-binding GntR family transcriptional regulator
MAGEYPAESLLSSADLCAEIRCDPEMLRRGMEMLLDEGLVLPHARPGTFEIAARLARSDRDTSFTTDYRLQGRRPEITTIDLTIVSSEDGPDLQEFFGDRTLIRHRHVQAVDGVPHAIADSFVPFQYLEGSYSQLRNGRSDLWELLEAAGVPPTRKREALAFDTPNGEERRLLDIESTPAVKVVRLDCRVWSGDIPVEFCRLVDRADLYQFIYEVDIP